MPNIKKSYKPHVSKNDNTKNGDVKKYDDLEENIACQKYDKINDLQRRIATYCKDKSIPICEFLGADMLIQYIEFLENNE